MLNLVGKSIMVTGGASGIGRAAVLLLAEAGARVTVADLDDAAGSEVLEALSKAARGSTQFVHTDVTREESVRASVDMAVSKFGRLDGAINAAGIAHHWKLVHELSSEEWDLVMNVNLRGMFFCIKHQVGSMLQTGGGAIVAIASIAAELGLPKSSEYCASKAGVTGLVRAAAIDYAKMSIRVNALLPGSTMTPMVERALATKPPDLGNSLSIPNGRRARAIEIAQGAVWMVSDATSYMSGSCVTIDGGLSVA